MPKIIEYILCLIENGIIFAFFNLLIERRFKNKFSVIAAVFVNAAIIFLCTELSVSLRAIIFVVITIIGSSIIFKGAIYIKSALSITLLFLLNMIDIVFGLLSSHILNEQIYDVFYESIIRRVILCLIIKVVDALVVFAVYKMFSKQRLEANKKNWVLFCLVISTFLFVTVIFTELYQNSSDSPSISVIYFTASIAFFITGLIAVYFFTYICSSFTNEKRLYVLQSSYDGIKEQLAVQLNNFEKISKIRHDTKNHLQNAQLLLSQGHYDTAGNLVAEMIEETDNIHLDYCALTGNDIIDAAITVKSAICKSRGIEFNLICERLPQINISEIDLSSLISNILDNAVTAAEKTDAPRVILKIFVRGEYLNIISENTYSNIIKKRDEGKLTTFFTTKCNSNEHGFGTRIIGEIAQKYDGACVYEYENGIFKMNVMINFSMSRAICEQI